MAKSRRRKKQGGNAGGLLLKALATLVVLLVMIGSFLLFIAWFFFEWKNSRLAKPTSLSFFDHTNDEKKSIYNQERSIDRILTRLESIEVEGRKLTKRQDGLYNERSQKGKQFNQEVAQLTENLNSLESSLSILESLPNQRLNEWAFYASMPLALRVSTISYILSFATFSWLQPKWVMQLSNTLQNYSLLDFYSSYPVAYGASVGSLVVSLILLCLSYLFFREKKIDDLTSVQQKHSLSANIEHNVNITKEISSDEIFDILSNQSHATLKSIVDTFGIEANKRSKASIIEALKDQNQSTIYNIYLSIQSD